MSKTIKRFRDYDDNDRFDRKRTDEARFNSRIKRDNAKAKQFIRETAGA